MKGWTKFKDEFNEIFRGLTQLGYAVFFIGHDKEVVLDKGKPKERTVIRPALSNSTRTVIGGLADIYGYAHQKEAGQMSVLTLRCSDGSIECGGRFKYIAEEIPTNYHKLVEAIKEAIDKEAAENNGQFVTDEKIVMPVVATYDFDELSKKFQSLVAELMTKDQGNSRKITSIVETYLGKGRKVGECTEEQAEQLDLIVRDLEAMLAK